MLQTDFRNADDHRYLQTVAARYGLYFSRPGNGICHQVHLERFGIPGKTLLGSDSHTPTAAASARWPSARAGSTWPSPWPASAVYVPMPASCWCG
jgi:aconitate hydratase